MTYVRGNFCKACRGIVGSLLSPVKGGSKSHEALSRGHLIRDGFLKLTVWV